MDKPTLTAGHTVDLLITRDEHLAVNISVCVPALSDHFVVHCNITPRFSGHFSITWFGFLYVQVSSGNCETMESRKICNFDPEASESC